MPTATETQELLSESACYACYGFSLEQILTLADLKRILLALDPSADTDVNSLLADNPCLDCYSNGTLFDIVEMALLAAIYNTSSAVGSFLTRAGITDATQIAALTQLYSDAVEHGWWEQCDVIYPFVGGTAQAHAQNLKSTNYSISWFGSVIHNSLGITGDNTSGYGDTGYVPILGPLWSLNNSAIGIYRRLPGTSTSRTYIAANVTGGGTSSIRRGLTLTTMGGTMNSVGSLAIPGNTAVGWNMVVRNDAVNIHLFNGLVDVPVADASFMVPTIQCYILAANNDGVAAAFTNATLQGATLGAGVTFAQFTTMKADWFTFQTSLGRQL